MRYVIVPAIAAMVAIMTSCGSKDAGLAKAVEEIKQAGREPEDARESTRCRSTSTTKYVIYNYLIDEEAIDMADLQGALDETKAQLSQTVVHNPANRKFTELVKKTGRGYKIVYKGNDSGEEAIILYSNDEL